MRLCVVAGPTKHVSVQRCVSTGLGDRKRSAQASRSRCPERAWCGPQAGRSMLTSQVGASGTVHCRPATRPKAIQRRTTLKRLLYLKRIARSRVEARKRHALVPTNIVAQLAQCVVDDLHERIKAAKELVAGCCFLPKFIK
jgi:hypothetical protein